MKITGNLQGVVTFKDIPKGDLFVYCDHLYMKVEPLVGCIATSYNAVNVETGLLATIVQPDLVVTPRDGEIVLK
jgi:hypothetical protein